MSRKPLSAGHFYYLNSPVLSNFKKGWSVHNLGQTRSCKRHNFFLLTPDTFVRTVLPDMKACSAIVHVSPAAGAKFAQYTAEFESGGELGGTDLQRFIYVLEGSLQLEVDGKKSELVANAYAYLPDRSSHRVRAARSCRAVVIEKPYQPLSSISPPKSLVSREDQVTSQPLADDPSLQVKCLLPDEMAFDFAVNTMVYQPGAALSMV